MFVQYPAMNHWANVRCPYGTGDFHGDRKLYYAFLPVRQISARGHLWQHGILGKQ
ncbi:hypothetical protein ACFL6S_09110 [Candidatus Poribacteria bacterium]